MSDRYCVNVSFDTRDRLLRRIVSFSNRELRRFSRASVPARLRKNPSLLRAKLLNVLRTDRPISGWQMECLSQFDEVRNEADRLAAYETLAAEALMQHHDGYPANLLEVHRPFMLMIDGNNLIHKIVNSPFRDRHFDTGLTWNQVEATLLERSDNRLKIYPESHGCVYLDRSEFESYPYSTQLRIVHSGGGDATDRADRAILMDLEVNRRYPNGPNPIVVSDDRWLGTQAANLGAYLMSAEDFLSLIEQEVA